MVIKKKKQSNFWNILGVVVVLGIVGYFLFFNNCVGEFKQITTGTMNSDEQCCNGLVLKSLSGYTGGGWCVKPECNIYCLTGNELLIGIEGEGIYADCPDGATLLKQVSC